MTAVNRRKKVIGLSLLAAAVIVGASMLLRSRKYEETAAMSPVADLASHPIYSSYEWLTECIVICVFMDPNESFRAQTAQAPDIYQYLATGDKVDARI